MDQVVLHRLNFSGLDRAVKLRRACAVIGSHRLQQIKIDTLWHFHNARVPAEITKTKEDLVSIWILPRRKVEFPKSR